MPRRLAHEDVAKVFAAEGAVLLSHYENAHQDLEFICSTPGCGEHEFIQWGRYKQGANIHFKCRKCNPRVGRVQGSRDKYSIEYYQKLLAEHGAVLLSTEYKNPQTELEFICSTPGCGRHQKMKAVSITHGLNPQFKCSFCNPKLGVSREDYETHTIEEVRTVFAEKGAILLTTEYPGFQGKLEFICSTLGCNNRHTTDFGHFRSGYNSDLLCPECQEKRRQERALKLRGEACLAFKQELEQKVKVLDVRYRGKTVEAKFICSNPLCNNTHTILRTTYHSGGNPNLFCTKCIRGNMFKPDNAWTSRRDHVDKRFLEHSLGFFNLPTGEDYAAHHIKPFSASLMDRLSYTNIYPLKRAIHLSSWVDPESKIQDPFHMDPNYLDVQNWPDYAKLPYHNYPGFEFLPLNEAMVTTVIRTEDESRELLRLKEDFAEQGIQFIPLTLEEIVVSQTRQVIFSMLRNRLYKKFPSIYKYTNTSFTQVNARDTEVTKLSWEEVSEFLNRTHIQGAVGGEVYLGLKNKEGKIVACMTFGKPRFNGVAQQYELLRYSCELNTSVRGGAQKLFKAFLKEYNPESIVSYCDIRFSSIDPQATMYPKLGFTFDHRSKPGYRYYDPVMGRSYSRLQFQKHKLPTALESYDEGLSAEENIAANGYIKLYDCGNFVFIWNK